ncbi:aldehyde dehydrogenase [Candidatus Marsarchaeota G2 archaeon OSP_D]|jgi:NAD-dependent aldehyde dehydrogenases|uniref:Aldehyde dehydrogenase n=5 Tax=Candidatus Marsarchaeota group 2 TaxID=2203771 RepID=A0A2R6B568_9ARCH|nr:MAG: aldehyde dehydrogenase [Candidatus Marsarchaeota G2 archaeon OSP_D]PSN93638.1 MAG: aldehyde dehydrogenase [Candidatus Marsarchaeota G2 archaeon ECH_B_2]PSN97613.1 MAG: aldehyde dehydrogenase [Candidatus Marsarchaeota G2 archaeon ECH_B_SAG-C16]PSN98033.1 MAG: aldehyde dehydrogenase [Candidatus Marsarchaeota G2 archaeon ECH_B_3]PSN99540.1 MAG: aldehyde dehydrogenase [Candidatus Marsarchaeota G2 archaeon ECH_B_1]
MTIKTFNPYTGEVLGEYQEESVEQIKQKIAKLREAQMHWARSTDARMDALREVKKRLLAKKGELAKLMSMEMGKPVSQSEAEVNKCAWLIDYAVENMQRFLEPEYVKTEAAKSYIRFDPLGVVLLVMPWNFPAWQVMRAAIPALAAGNAVILKHASIVTGTSLMLEQLFGLDVFRSTVARGETALAAIEYVDGVSFTGSTSVGSTIASEAGKRIKKSVLELGGSDPFIVLGSADLDKTVKNAVYARLQNNGQSCIASKRFLVHQSVYDEFSKLMREEFAKVAVGDPLSTSTFLGPLSSTEQKRTVVRQLEELGRLGRVHRAEARDDGNFVPPTLVETGALYTDEVFGPVAILKKFSTMDEAVQLANETPYGLGASIWGDPEEAEKLVPNIQAGMVFINKVVASDPRLPFGGVKKSGYGRELSRYGMLEFTNIRTVWVN